MVRVESIDPAGFSASRVAPDCCFGDAPDIIDVDNMTPAAGGNEFIGAVRGHAGISKCRRSRSLPATRGEVGYAALDAGATDSRTKPVDKREVVAPIRKMTPLRHGQKPLAGRAALLAEEGTAASETTVEREHETIFRLAKAAG